MNRIELKALAPSRLNANAVQGFLYACPDSLGLDRGLSVVAFDFPNERVAGFYIIPDAHLSVHHVEDEMIVELTSTELIDPEQLKAITMEYFGLPSMELN